MNNKQLTNFKIKTMKLYKNKKESYNRKYFEIKHLISGLISILFTGLLLVSCKHDYNFNEYSNLEENSNKVTNDALLEISYTLLSSTIYQTDPLKLSESDIAVLTPINEKKRIEMSVFENGGVELTVDILKHDKEISIEHQILPNDIPSIVKTEVKNGQIFMYNTTGNLVHSQAFDLPNQIQMVQKLREMEEEFTPAVFNQMMNSDQGQLFIDNIDELIANSPGNGVSILEQGTNYVTLRMPKDEDNLETVLLIDRIRKNVAGTRLYKDNELLMSKYYAYDTKDFHMVASKELTTKLLPSGDEVNTEIHTKYEDYEMKINL